jgi:catechol 2,3-dioxygenase-like lactoylglutathione lyase family enzyme
MKERKIIQVGIVVHDMDRALEQYTRVFGAGPWDIYEFGPPEMREPTYMGKPSEWSALLALTWVGDRHVELIKPLKGPNVYYDFIEKHGAGIHHIKEWVEDCGKAIAEYKKKGIEVIQSGKFGEDEFYYLNTEPTLGILLEIGNNGNIRPPDRRYPA